MPRPPDPNSKTAQIIIKPRNIEEEKKIRGAKEIVARNPELTMIDVLEPFLKQHNWPPGNSQKVLDVYGVKPEKKCFRCGELFPSLEKVEFISGLIKSECSDCLKVDRERGVVKRVL